MNNELGLPDDFWQFISEGKQLVFDAEQCEAGPVELRSPHELKLERLPVETYPTSFRDEDPLLNEKGTYDEYGFYYVSGIPLTMRNSVTYSILIWLPLEKVFAAYEESHHDLLLFSTATWTEIATDPLIYLNAHWEVDFEERNSRFVCELKPWLAHPFRVGLTLDEVEKNRAV